MTGSSQRPCRPHSGGCPYARSARCEAPSPRRSRPRTGTACRPAGLRARARGEWRAGGRAVGLVAAERRVGYAKTHCQLSRHCGEHRGRRRRARDQCRNASQRRLLVGEDSDLITTHLSLPPALVGLGGTQSGLAGYHIRQYCNGQEDQDRYPIPELGGTEGAFIREVDIRVGEGAGHGRHSREPESPTSRDDKDSRVDRRRRRYFPGRPPSSDAPESFLPQ